MAHKSFRLYQIDGVDYASIIATYRQLCENGVKDYDDSTVTMTGGFELKYTYRKKPRMPLRDDTRVLNKAKYLIHTIAYRWLTNPDEEGGVPILMSVLQDVIGEDAFELMTALVKSGYVRRSPFYKVGKFSRRYTPIGNIIKEECTNATIRKYIEKTKVILSEKIITQLSKPEFTEEYGKDFVPTYNKNLNKFKLSDPKGYDKFVEKIVKENPQAAPYYDFIKESFKRKLKIYSIDENHRMYHILTNLKRELKQYLNIKFIIDASNSHPFLFNYFIFLSKRINVKTSYRICEILNTYKDLIVLSKDYRHPKSNIFFINNVATVNDEITCVIDSRGRLNHYDTGILRNILINSGIRKADIDKFEPDELLYIWKTSAGIFWDDILRAHENEGLTRDYIKMKMFAEVFYSRTGDEVWKRFFRDFVARFPHVYDLISRWKTPLSDPDIKAVLLRRNKAIDLGDRVWMREGEESTALPNIMMDFESVIFRDILKALFRERISAVHIHDAIVVPAVKGTENVDPEQICEVMRHAYRRFGLYPNLKVDTY